MAQSDHQHDDGITVWTVKGKLSYPDLQSKMTAFGTTGHACRVLCDLTKASMSALTAKELEDLIKMLGRQINGSSGGKAALVAHTGVDYDLARMFSTFAELAGLPVTVKVFRTAEVAQDWLSNQHGEHVR